MHRWLHSAPVLLILTVVFGAAYLLNTGGMRLDCRWWTLFRKGALGGLFRVHYLRP